MEDPRDYPELGFVVTQTEAARMAHVAYSTMYSAVQTGKVASIECGGVILVAVRSLKKAYPHSGKRKKL